jgi:hypothetical protein
MSYINNGIDWIGRLFVGFIFSLIFIPIIIVAFIRWIKVIKSEYLLFLTYVITMISLIYIYLNAYLTKKSILKR